MMIYLIVFSETAAQLIGDFSANLWVMSGIFQNLFMLLCWVYLWFQLFLKRNLQNWNGFRFCWETQLWSLCFWALTCFYSIRGTFLQLPSIFWCQPGWDSISALWTVMVAFRTSKRVSSLWALKSKNHHELQQISYDSAHFHMIYLPFRLIHFHSDFWRLAGVFSFNKHRQHQKSRWQAILEIYSHPDLFYDRFNLPDSFHLFHRQGICMYHFWWA